MMSGNASTNVFSFSFVSKSIVIVLISAYLQIPLPLHLPLEYSQSAAQLLPLDKVLVGQGTSAAAFCLVPFFLLFFGFFWALVSADARNIDAGAGAVVLQTLSPLPQLQHASLAVVPKLA